MLDFVYFLNQESMTLKGLYNHNQIVTKHSGQSMGLMIWRLWVQTPLGAIFDEIYFVLCNFRFVR